MLEAKAEQGVNPLLIRSARRSVDHLSALIETIPAVFAMDEILFELRDHITGLDLVADLYIDSRYPRRFQR